MFSREFNEIVFIDAKIELQFDRNIPREKFLIKITYYIISEAHKS